LRYNISDFKLMAGSCREMRGQVVDELIHVDLAIDIVKLLFKTEMNSESPALCTQIRVLMANVTF
jgi:hypothetical protein